MLNRICRKLMPDGTKSKGLPMCEKHINAAPEGVLEITSASTGAECVECVLEQQDSVPCIDPQKVTAIMQGLIMELEDQDVAFLHNSAQLQSMLAGFIYALMEEGLAREDIIHKSKSVFLNCWAPKRDIDNPTKQAKP